MIVVSLIVILFLLHWRSALSIIIQIPITDCHEFYPAQCFRAFLQYHVADRNCAGHRCDRRQRIIMSENSYRHLSERQNNPPA